MTKRNKAFAKSSPRVHMPRPPSPNDPFEVYRISYFPILFHDGETERAQIIASACLTVVSASDPSMLVERLKFIVHRYDRDLKYVNRPSAQEHKRRLQQVRDTALKLKDKLAALPKETLGQLRRELGKDAGNDEKLPSLYVGLDSLIRHIDLRTIAFTKGKAGSKEQVHIKDAAQRLAALYQECTGTRWKKTLDSGEHGAGTRAFAADGPRFVQAALVALDPNLTFENIRSAIAAVGLAELEKQFAMRSD